MLKSHIFKLHYSTPPVIKDQVARIGGGPRPLGPPLPTPLIDYLNQRIPVEETTWLGFLKLGAAYPDAIVTHKFGLLQSRLNDCLAVFS